MYPPGLMGMRTRVLINLPATGAVQVSWDQGANATGYIVYRNGNWAGRVNDPAVLTFTNTNVPAGAHTWSVASIRPDNSKTAQTSCGGL